MSRNDTFASLLERAQSLSDYLELRSVSSEHGPPPSDVLAGLSDVFGVPVDHPFLQRRLSWDGVGPSLAFLGSDPSGRASEEAWWRLMMEMCRTPVSIEAGHPADPARLIGVTLLPEIWAPFVGYAYSHFRSQVSDLDSLLGPTAQEELCRSLYLQLDRFLGPSVAEVFDVYRAVVKSDGNGRSARASFIDACLNQVGLPVFSRYPVVARCSAVLVDQWVKDAVLLLERLSSDKERIRSDLFSGRDPGALVGIEDCDGDRHDGGRVVRCLTFESGDRVIYKPRPVDMESGFRSLIEWLEVRGVESIPPAARVCTGDGYGWVAFVEAGAELEAEEVAAYYQSAGGLLALVYLLSGTDCHMDNVIASPGGPVLIDAEMLFQPTRHESARAVHEALGTARALIDASVVSTGLLQFTQMSQGRMTEAGGLTGTADAGAGVEMALEHGGTDQVQRVMRPVAMSRASHLPYVSGESVVAGGYVDEIVAGFRKVLSSVIDRRSDWLAEGGALSFFRDATVRLVFRSSQQYAEFMRLMMQPRVLMHGLKRSLFMERVGNQFGQPEQRPALWPFFVQERRSIEAMDIPCFRVGVDDVVADLGGDGSVEGYLEQSGLARVRQRIEGLSAAELDRQEILIRSLLASEGHVTATGECIESDSDSIDFVDVARRVGDMILAEGIRGEDGSLTWIEPSHLKASGSASRGAAFCLYTGVSGVALYLAELARVTRGEVYREAAEQAVAPLCLMLSDERLDAFAAAEPVGACEGLAGISFGLGEMGACLGDDRFSVAADRVLDLVTSDRICAAEAVDVQSGLAGALLVLLGDANRVDDASRLERAVLCGEQLAKRSVEEGGGVAWADESGVLHTGFAHGVAGIGLALVRLHVATGDPRWLELAERAFAYERSCYDEVVGNWPLQGVKQAVCMNAWCHGAAGIALSRAEALSSVAHPDWESDLRVSIEAFSRQGGAPVDFLCCGSAGLSLIASSLRELVPDVDGVPDPRKILGAGVRLWEQSGAFRLPSRVPSVSLFRGLAGIGCACLRAGSAAGGAGLPVFRNAGR